MPLNLSLNKAEKPVIPGQRKAGLQALSKREKNMLWGLAIAGAAAAIILLLLMPQRAQLAELGDSVSLLETEQAQVESLIARLPAAQQDYKTALVDYEDAGKRFQAPMRAEDLDAMITQMLTDCGFSPETLSLSEMTQETVSLYGGRAAVSSMAGAEVPATDGAADDVTDAGVEGGTESLAEVQADLAETGAAAETAVADAGLANVCQVNVSAKGSLDQLYALMDRVRERGGVKLASCSWTPGRTVSVSSEDGESTTEKQMDSFSLTFKVYINGGAV